MQLTIKQILENLKSLTPSEKSELKDGKNVFEALQLPAVPNNIAKQLYNKWEVDYQKMINTSFVEHALPKDSGKIEKVLDLQFEANATEPTQEAYELLARQLRDYYERHEDDDDGPFWTR